MASPPQAAAQRLAGLLHHVRAGLSVNGPAAQAQLLAQVVGSSTISRQHLHTDGGASISGRSPDPWHHRPLHLRGLAAQAAPSDQSSDTSSIGNEKVQKLAQELLSLTVLESSWLTEILRKKLNLQKPAYGAMPVGGFMGQAGAPQPQMAAPQAAGAPAGAAPPPPAEAKKEKTDFDVKLESFSADGKIKVIKEIRAITNLGLKEAKELVEKAPVVIKGGVAKADAENMKKLIEAAGGKVSLA